jgi:1-deoxy-D-xylulose-5-phosphate synthase
MPEGTGLDEFEKRFPERFFNVGMAEEHAVGFAAGLAKKGLTPVIAIYSTFLQRSYDQIIHDVCLQNLHVVFCIDRAGVVGEDGPTHHGAFDISYLRHIPNLVSMAPKDLEELKSMLDFAVAYNGPVSIRYPRGGVIIDEQYQTENFKYEEIKLGKAEVLATGKDIALLAIGDMVLPSFEAAHILSKYGIQGEVINMRFIKPIDEELILNLAEKTKKIIVAEDNILKGGFGSAVLEVLNERNKGEIQVKRIGLPDAFIAHAPRKELLREFGLTAEKIAAAARELCKQGCSLNANIPRPFHNAVIASPRGAKQSQTE